MYSVLVLVLACLLCLSAVKGDIKPRQEAPKFTAKAVQDDKFIDVSLKDIIAKEMYTVLLFYPADWTFVCPSEIIEFSSHDSDFKALKMGLDLGIHE